MLELVHKPLSHNPKLCHFCQWLHTPKSQVLVNGIFSSQHLYYSQILHHKSVLKPCKTLEKHYYKYCKSFLHYVLSILDLTNHFMNRTETSVSVCVHILVCNMQEKWEQFQCPLSDTTCSHCVSKVSILVFNYSSVLTFKVLFSTIHEIHHVCFLPLIQSLYHNC